MAMPPTEYRRPPSAEYLSARALISASLGACVLAALWLGLWIVTP
jgi:hypothetical protein